MEKNLHCKIFEKLFKGENSSDDAEADIKDQMKVVIVNRDDVDELLCSQIKQEINDSDQTNWKSIANIINRKAAKKVQITDVFHSATADSDEYIEISNKGILHADISGWILNAGDKGQNFLFPEETMLFSQKKVRVYTKIDDKNPQRFSFGKKSAIWNNKGDVGYLHDASNKPISGWAYGDEAIPFIEITDIVYDGKKQKVETDEYVEITNASDLVVDISEWRINAGKNQDFVFPEKTVLLPNSFYRVYTNEIHKETGGFSFGINKSIWNNKGDTGTLFNNRNKEVSSWTYEGRE